MGFLDILSGIPIVGPVISGLSGHAQAKAQEATAGYQANVSQAEIESQERIFNETIALDRDKFDFLKEQTTAQSAEQLQFEKEQFGFGKEVYASELEFRKTEAKVTPTSQVGTISYPYVSVKAEKAKPSLSILLLVAGAGAVYFFVLRR